MSTTHEPITVSMDRVIQDVDQIAAIIDPVLTPDSRARIFGAEILPFFDTDTSRVVPAVSVIRLALLCDCLRVVDMALRADGRVTAEEIYYVEPLIFPAARFYAKHRKEYAPFGLDNLEAFLDYLRQDTGLFGHACEATRWLGFDICRRVAAETHDSGVLDIYERMVKELMDEITAVGGVSRAEALERARFQGFLELRKKMEESAALDAGDPRIDGFCNPHAPEVFSATEYARQVWEHDPFDVDWVHPEARAGFERLVDRVTAPVSRDHGAILLILGESGSGKTHLMRAFRNHVHGRQLGYAGYMQMATHETDYGVHILGRLIDSLERPYDPLFPDVTGLLRLSDAVAETPAGVTRDALDRLRDDDFDSKQAVHDHVRALADAIVATPGYRDFDPDLLRALLYLQRRDPVSRSRVLKYLRARPMGARDLADIGELSPPPPPTDMIQQLGRLMWQTQQAALVLLIDQLEEVTDLQDAPLRFRHVFTAVRHLIDHLPSAVVVISCLENAYAVIKQHLTQSLLDRVERDPDPVSLSPRRSLDEIEAIVGKRLAYLYDSLDIRSRDDDLFPFRRADLSALANLRTRDVLDWCRQYRERCIDARGLVAPPPVGTVGDSRTAAVDPSIALEQAWDGFRDAQADDPPEDDAALLEHLAWAVQACADELEPGYQVTVERDGEHLRIHAPDPRGQPERLVVAMTNKDARGGGLGRQIEAVAARAADQRAPGRPVVVRCAPFPNSSRAKVVKRLAKLIASGGRRVVVEDGEWRTIMALRAFVSERHGHADLATWRRRTRPLTQLKALCDLLGLDPDRQPVRPAREAPGGDRDSAPVQPAQPAPAPVQPAQPAPAPVQPAQPAPAVSRNTGPLRLGRTLSLASEELTLGVDALTRHGAFLGSTGSGKTTLALNVVEQLLVRGVPVVLVDRKGDLAGYARGTSFWQEAPEDPERRARKQALDRDVDVRLYTPGEPRGRPLSIPVVPAGMADVPSHERSQMARYAASALAGMMSYRDTNNDRTRLVILAKAIEVLAQSDAPAPLSLDQLSAFIHDEDPMLVNAIGKLNTRHFSKLVEHLETLRLNSGALLDSDDAPLDPDDLFGRGAGRTRLSIISTKFLGDQATILFWISRLLIEVSRWAGKHPSKRLQAVLLFDEADMYLPAQAKPPTKEPMQDLLKRARSAGLGVLLATQSPADLDYRCRDNIGTWFVGNVAEERAIGKMKPLLGDYRDSIAKKLPGQRVGEFHMLRDGRATAFKAERSLLETSQLAEERIRDLARGPGRR